MCKTRGFFGELLVVSIAAVLCGYVLAAEPSAQRDQDKAKQPTQQSTQQQRQSASQLGTETQMSGKLHRTSKLIGKKVKGIQNEDLGHVYDLVLTSDHQQVSYAALSSGGAWGMGAKYYAVPWSAIQVGAQGDITTSLNKSQLEQATAFDKNNWPVQANMQLTSSTGQGTTSSPSSQTDTSRQGTGRIGMAMGAGAMAANRDVQFRRVNHITGTSVRNAEGEDIGDIEDFVIDASQGQVAYAVISFGGVWGIGEKFAAVPSTAIDIQSRRHMARLDADRNTLEKIAFASDEFPDLSNREYAQQLHETFHAEPYWTVLGYVGAEQDQAASQRAWGTESQFAKHFDAKNVKTIQGTVESIGSFLPEDAAPGSSGGMRIRLTTDDGKLITVYAGPQWYAQQNDFYVKPGDKINVTGSQTKIGWRPVLVASQIKAGDRTLRLRNETGQPLWPGQPAGQGTTPSTRPGQSSTQPGSTSQQQEPEPDDK